MFFKHTRKKSWVYFKLTPTYYKCVKLDINRKEASYDGLVNKFHGSHKSQR